MILQSAIKSIVPQFMMSPKTSTFSNDKPVMSKKFVRNDVYDALYH